MVIIIVLDIVNVSYIRDVALILSGVKNVLEILGVVKSIRRGTIKHVLDLLCCREHLPSLVESL